MTLNVSGLVRVGGKLEALGKMAELARGRSRLQLGAQGVYRQNPFTVVGRIQLRYEHGLWNEWFLLFRDQCTGWLSEAAGTYAISFQWALTDVVPAFSELRPGGYLRHLGGSNAEWTVTNIDRATCVAGEGELPFRVGGGYPAPVADLHSSTGNAFATLDYSENERIPLLFLGETVDFPRLNWCNLREEGHFPQPTLQAKALRCQKCGAPLKFKNEGTVSATCVHCGSIVDAETGGLINEINLANSQKITPLIPMGSTGVFRGDKLEVIGFMQRYLVSEGQKYSWREYLLARVGSPGYRFLVEYNGHWSVVDALEVLPKASRFRSSLMEYRRQTFKHFQSYTGIVEYVIGEFTWRVKMEDAVQLTDYVAPPFMLTLERTDNEISWSLAEYVPSQEIAAAFKLENLPKPVGVYANQPNPLKKQLRHMWAVFAMLALFALVAEVAMFSNKIVAQGNVAIAVGSDPMLLPPFNLDQTSSLVVESRAQQLDNEWLEVGLALVRESDGDVRSGSVELSYYSGQDSDGSWSEDDLSHSLVFRDVPPGTWRLLVDGVDSGSSSGSSQSAAPTRVTALSLEVREHRAPAENFMLLWLLLFLWPTFLSFRRILFENKRWAESDHSS